MIVLEPRIDRGAISPTEHQCRTGSAQRGKQRLGDPQAIASELATPTRSSKHQPAEKGQSSSRSRYDRFDRAPAVSTTLLHLSSTDHARRRGACCGNLEKRPSQGGGRRADVLCSASARLPGWARSQSSRPALTCIIGARVDRADDLLDVDPLQIHARRGDVRMPELALDYRQRHALPGEFDGVSMAELVLVPTSAQAPLSSPRFWMFTTSTNGS
jgi:hypothetical protein